MRWRLALLVAIVASGCGERRRAPAGTDPAAIGALLPADAYAVVRIASLDRVETLLAQVNRVGGPGPGLSRFLGRWFGVDPETIDRGLPIVAAANLRAFPRPQLTAVLPTRDPAATARAFRRGPVELHGGYVALSEDPDYVPGKCALYEGLPDGDFVVRFDVKKIAASLGPLLDRGLGAFASNFSALAGPDGDAAAAAFRDWAQRVLADGDTFEVGVTLDRPTLRGEVAYRARAGTPLAAVAAEARDFAELARFIPPGLPLVAMGRVRVEMLGPLLSREFGVDAKLFDGLGPDVMIGLDPREDSRRVVGATTATDPGAFVQALERTVRGRGTFEGERQTAGFHVRRWWDAEAKAGLDIAVRGEQIVLVVDRERKLAATVLAGQGPPPDVKRAMAEVGGNLQALCLAELRALANAPAGPPVPLTVYGYSADRTFRYGAVIDLDGALALLESK